MKTRQWANAYAYCLSLFSIVALIAYAIARFREVFEPFEHNYAEGIILYQILHILNLAEAYRPIAEYPHIVFHYTPLYHVIVNLLGRTGLDYMITARMISVLATVGLGVTCAALVLCLVPVRTGKPIRYAAALSSTAFALFSVSVTSCSAEVRSDMFGLSLAILGLWIFVRFGDRRPMQWLAFVLFTAAIYCKQTMISAPVACLAASLLIGRRLFVQVFSLLLVLGGGTLAIFLFATNGLFVQHIFLYNVNPYLISRAVKLIGQHAFSSLPILVCGLAMMCFTAFTLWPTRARVRFLLRSSVRARALFCVVLFTLFGMVMSITIGKQGGADNYFLEWDTGIAVLAGSFVAYVLAPRRASIISPSEWAALLFPIFWILDTTPAVYRSIRPSEFMKERAQIMESSYAQLVPMLRALPQPVISEDMTLLVKAGKPIPMEPAIFYGLAVKGVLDEEPFLARLRRQEFAAIITIHDLDYLFTTRMAQTITNHYHSAEQIGPFHLYRPIAEPSSAARSLDLQGR